MNSSAKIKRKWWRKKRQMNPFITRGKAENQKLENNKLWKEIAEIWSMQSLFILKAAFTALFLRLVITF